MKKASKKEIKMPSGLYHIENTRALLKLETASVLLVEDGLSFQQSFDLINQYENLFILIIIAIFIKFLNHSTEYKQKITLILSDSMNQPKLPSLSLFNKVLPKSRRQQAIMSTTNDYSIYNTLRQSQRIQNQAYLPEVIPSSSLCHEKDRLDRYRMEIDYLNGYKDALIKQELKASASGYPSLHSTYRQQSLHSFGGRQDCDCETLGLKSTNEAYLVKNAYVHPSPTFTPLPPPPEKSRQNSVGVILNKNPYLNRPQEQPIDSSIMNVIGDISKFIQQEKPENIDKSIMINNNSLKPPVAEAEIQTQDPNMLRSSFLISKVVEKTPQLMNEQNFRMTIKRLNQSINSLHIDLNSEDLIIDLSDLVLTKDQYIEESNVLLTKLSNLSSGKMISMTKQKKKGGIVWPEGV